MVGMADPFPSPVKSAASMLRSRFRLLRETLRGVNDTTRVKQFEVI
jgi:hypothetical protein